VTYNRHRILCEPENVDLVRNAFKYIMGQHHFKIDAIVILPEPIHALWTWSETDADFSIRWRSIKSYFSRQCHSQYQGKISTSRQHKGEKAIWQRRFWEHQVRDGRQGRAYGDRDFVNHLEYIHYNPVHHGLVNAPKDWQHSSFHRYVEEGIYDQMWGASERLIFDSDIGME